MTPEERKILEHILSLTEQNTEDIQKIRRDQVVGRFFKILYWLIIIGIAIGSFYFVQPYVEQLQDTYTGIKTKVDSVGGILDSVQGLKN